RAQQRLGPRGERLIDGTELRENERRRIHHTAVVPANAGTHDHRPLEYGSPLSRGRQFERRLQPDLAEIDAGPETRFDELLIPALRRYLDQIRARALVELVEFEIAIMVARGLRDRSAILAEANARTLDAIDDAIRLRRKRAADEAFRVPPEIAIITPRMGAQLGFHHFEILFARQARHLLILDLDRPHGAGRARLLAAGLLPALVDEVGIERPDLRQLQLFVPPDV